MTTHRFTECIHCGDVYNYQPSGHGCHRKENDSNYCPECKTAMDEALKKIDVKYEYRWVETNEISRQQALDIIAEDERIAKEKLQKERDRREKCPNCDLIIPFSGMLMTRVFPGLFKVGSGESSIEKEFTHERTKYHISYWESNLNDYNIRKEVRWDIINDKEAVNQNRFHRNK